jgi:hypothetical protein
VIFAEATSKVGVPRNTPKQVVTKTKICAAGQRKPARAGAVPWLLRVLLLI